MYSIQKIIENVKLNDAADTKESQLRLMMRATEHNQTGLAFLNSLSIH
jgi:hypothetical protein